MQHDARPDSKHEVRAHRLEWQLSDGNLEGLWHQHQAGCLGSITSDKEHAPCRISNRQSDELDADSSASAGRLTPPLCLYVRNALSESSQHYLRRCIDSSGLGYLYEHVSHVRIRPFSRDGGREGERHPFVAFSVKINSMVAPGMSTTTTSLFIPLWCQQSIQLFKSKSLKAPCLLLLHPTSLTPTDMSRVQLLARLPQTSSTTSVLLASSKTRSS